MALIPISNDQFIIESQIVHGSTYDYSKVDCVSRYKKVEIVCKKHGSFFQSLYEHKLGKGCSKCGRERRSTKVNKGNLFVERSKKVHGERYNYSKVDYVRSDKKVRIICSEHGEFWQTPQAHLEGYNCPKCYHTRLTFTKEQFLEKANKIHNNKYDYSNTNYTKAHNKIKIICPIHGDFDQKASKHLEGHGCKKCKSSRGERQIKKVLDNLYVIYEEEKIFDCCVNDKTKKPLRFDFYLPGYNTCVEFDGIQHFKPVNYWGGQLAFESRCRNDHIKNSFCADNNINLIRIKYDDNINEKMRFLTNESNISK